MTRLHERSWTHDRSDWGRRLPNRAGGRVLRTSWDEPGPWHDEPDKVQWIDAETDLDCLAVRNHFGAWCGYVGVPPGHPCHGKGYDTLDVRVHGGLTFADQCNEDAPEGHGICHVPLPGRSDAVWWLGFDCGHSMDLAPRVIVIDDIPEPPPGSPFAKVYRDLPYVQAECANLARQLADLARAEPS
ncbi:MAG TPA: hypothetical protein VFX53_04600 [Pedococcus sp.]|nr:hypothetical protein [Pedococcus sp.]